MIERIAATQQGKLRGIPGRNETVTVFKGVPYAKAPVGELRWREPQPPVAWSGIREAGTFGAIPVQTKGYFMSTAFEDLYLSEDCLYLNIWTPDVLGSAPVMVWFYGGAFQGGCSSDPMFDGESFAGQGIIVVTVNYRVGIMGNLAHPEMRSESPYGTSGNFTVLDQIAALKWVQANIAAFGGDPAAVTIAGQSAGGGSVCNMISSPLAKGLFRQAIIQSGDRLMGDPHKNSGEHPEEIGKKLAELLGDGTLASLRALPYTELVRPDYDAAKELTGRMCSPYIDGVILPYAYEESLNSSIGNNVPMIVGSNLDEGFIGANVTDFTEALSMFGDEAAAIAEAYPRGATEEEMRDTLTAIGSVQWKLRLAVWGQLRAERMQLPTWHYQFCRRTQIDGRMFGARHSSELSYVYNSYDAMPPQMMRFAGSANRELSNAMNHYWGNFIKTGDPNGDGLPLWQSKEQAPEQHMRFDDNWGMENDIAEPREELILLAVRRALL